MTILPSPGEELPAELRELVEQELEAGEIVDWLGQPQWSLWNWSRGNPDQLGLFLFGIPWTAFALFWTAGAAWITSTGDRTPFLARLFPLFGLPFVAVGVGMLSSPWRSRRVFRNSVYLITDRRVLLFTGGASVNVRSLSPAQLVDVQRQQSRDGSGDVVIHLRQWPDAQKPPGPVVLKWVPNVKDVEWRIKQLADHADADFQSPDSEFD